MRDRLASHFGRFARDERGLLSVEAAIMAPLLVFFLMMMYTTFDVFRLNATNSKAAYTIGDLLSRETEPVDQGFIDGMKDIFDYITLGAPASSWIRVSVVRYDGDDDEFKLLWSQVGGTATALTDETFPIIEGHIPNMAEEDTVVVVETYMPYTISLKIGWTGFNLAHTVITRPRFASQLCWETCN